MKLFSALRRPVLAVLPALLAASACSDKDDKPVTPTVDHGRVNAYHMAASANVNLKFLFDDSEKGNVAYGQNIGYQSLEVGSRVLKVNNGSAFLANQTLTVAKDKSYSVFAYSPTAAIGSVGLLTITDDLTAPAANTAKVRLVHLGVDAATPVRLSTAPAVVGGAYTDVTTDVAFGAASDFVTVNTATPFNLVVTTTGTARTQVAAVGDGNGAGTGTKTFDSGKIYTVVVRGIAGAAVPASQQIQAVIVQNN